MKAAMSKEIIEILKDEKAAEELIRVGIGDFGYETKTITANNQEYEATLLSPFSKENIRNN